MRRVQRFRLKKKTGKVDHKPQKYSTLGSNHNRLNMDNADMECDAMANMGTRHCMGLVRGERGTRSSGHISRFPNPSFTLLRTPCFVHTSDTTPLGDHGAEGQGK